MPRWLSRPSVSFGGARRRQIWSDAATAAATVRILLRPSARYAIAPQATERSRDLCVERGTGLSLIGGPLYTVVLERTYFRVVKSETIVPATEAASQPRTPSAKASRALLLFNHHHSLAQSVSIMHAGWLAGTCRSQLFGHTGYPLKHAWTRSTTGSSSSFTGSGVRERPRASPLFARWLAWRVSSSKALEPAPNLLDCGGLLPGARDKGLMPVGNRVS